MPTQPLAATGAQYKAFYRDDSVWNPDRRSSWYLEEDVLRVDGEKVDNPSERFGDTLEKLPDEAAVEVLSGWMVWQGDGADPSNGGQDLAAAFQAWCKARTTLTLVARLDVPVETPREDLVRLVEALEALGAVVTGLPDPARKPDAKAP